MDSLTINLLVWGFYLGTAFFCGWLGEKKYDMNYTKAFTVALCLSIFAIPIIIWLGKDD